MKTLDFSGVCPNGAEKVVKGLQALLADFQVYYANLRGMHWTIKGKSFFVLHSKFEEMYDAAAANVDEIAERILMLGGVPENKMSAYANLATVKEVSGIECGKEAMKNILDTYKVLMAKEREVLVAAEEAKDVVTADQMTGYLAGQEKLVWMLLAYLDEAGACKC